MVFFGVNPVFSVDRGLADGFDHWQAEVGWSAGRLNQAVLDWVDTKRDPSRPLFLHVHYFDPHCPYIPPTGVTVVPPIADSGRTVPEDRAHELGGCYGLTRPDGSIERDVDEYLDRYDAELRAVDAAVDRLLTRLLERGIGGPEDRVVWTSDHGEAFWEHDDYGHSHTLWGETTWVPLVVWDGHGTGTVDTPLSLVSLFDGLSGGPDAPLVPLRPPPSAAIVQQTNAGGLPWLALVANGEKWMTDGQTAWVSDVRTDPLDRHAVAQHSVDVPQVLQALRKGAPKPVPLAPSPEERERLRLLGYSL